MSNDINDGGAAFPALDCGRVYEQNDGGYSVNFESSSGMTLRDWFAGQAIARAAEFPSAQYGHDENMRIAVDAYKLADAMLAVRAARSS